MMKKEVFRVSSGGPHWELKVRLSKACCTHYGVVGNIDAVRKRALEELVCCLDVPGEAKRGV